MFLNEIKFKDSIVVASIEARMASTRLPGKVMMDVMGKPILEHIVDRLRCVKRIDKIVVATTLNALDDKIEYFCNRKGVSCFRGSEFDVLDRVINAGRFLNAEVLVEVTGDCPLIDPEIITSVIDSFMKSDADYCSNGLNELTYIRGLDVEIYPLKILEKVASLTASLIDREHVSYYIYNNPQKFKLKPAEINIPEEATSLRLTVDYNEDLELIRKIFNELYPKNSVFGIFEISSLISSQPDLKKINAHIKQKYVK